MTTTINPTEPAAVAMLAALRRWYAHMFGEAPYDCTLKRLRERAKRYAHSADSEDDLAEIGLIEALLLAEQAEREVSV